MLALARMPGVAGVRTQCSYLANATLLQGNWAIPGGFVDENEPLEAAAARELQEETSVDPSSVDLIQVAQLPGVLCDSRLH